MGVTQPASMRISLCVDLSNIYMKKWEVMMWDTCWEMLLCVPRLDNWSLHLLLLPNICSHYSCPGCVFSSPHCQGDIFAHVNAVKLRRAGIWVQLSQKLICPLPSQSKLIQVIMMVTYFLFPNSVHSKIKTKTFSVCSQCLCVMFLFAYSWPDSLHICCEKFPLPNLISDLFMC